MSRRNISRSAKLTKKYFMELPDGLFIISNRFTPGFRPIYSDKVIETRPIYAETVTRLSEREGQWKEIVKARVDQRICRVFKTKQHYKAWLSKVDYRGSDGKYYRCVAPRRIPTGNSLK